MATIGEAFALAWQHYQAGNIPQAEQLYRQILRADPSFAEAHTNLGHVLVRQERYVEAIAEYQQALRLKPDQFEAHYILAIALRDQGQLNEAAAHFQQAVRLRPDFAGAYSELGGVLRTLGRLDEAVDCCRQAIRLNPQSVEAHNNLGAAYLSQGRADLALACSQEAVRLQPDSAPARSNWLFCLNYDPQAEPDAVFEEHRRWGRLHTPAAPPPPHANDPTPERRLRIGYVSPDLRQHAVARYIEPVLAHHNPQQVEVFCYAEVAVPDAVTARLQSLAHGWCWTCGLTDAQMARRIRGDRIDLLVDLAGHSAHNRLGVFALKPAPVQATWLGYMNTTGLAAVDYRLTDDVLDPADQPQRDTEELVRLPSGMCCFAPPADAPAVTPLPAQRRGHLTFGSLHPLFKLNARVFGLWSSVLQRLPTARLLLFRDTLAGRAREHILSQFRGHGIASHRLDLRQWSGAPGYLGVYDDIDVTLDAFPCTGGVTTCESLWMGVPVLSLCGVRPAARNAAALLARVGLSAWAVDTPERYAAWAVGLAEDLDRLAQLRAGLRDRVQATLCDARRFTRLLEDAYRTLWRRWCARQVS
jgi:predicted O-linked N-acetylglucosamine transferase (SPINDLY family)